MRASEDDGRRSAAAPPGPLTRAAFGVMAGAMTLGVTMMLGTTTATTGQERPGPPQPEPAAARDAGMPDADIALHPLEPSPPTWLSIPAIGVEAGLMAVGLDEGGWIGAPPAEQGTTAGWYEGAAAPGSRGTAVLTGHVDTPQGHAVFYDLGLLGEGDTVEVAREDGWAVEFTVYEVAVYDKDQFPDRVYRDGEQAEIRLLTCGGSYREGSGYQDNVVVFARMSGLA